MDFLTGHSLNVCFGHKTVLKDVDINIPKGKRTALIGPNGSGKSTILKTLSGYYSSTGGTVYFDGIDIKKFGRKALARKMAILPQSPSIPADLTVGSLVEYGRFPHRSWWSSSGDHDGTIVDWALAETGVLHLKHRLVHTLSGGERQRAWIAMALAQKPILLMLDEPTTYLDISHQLDIMQLITGLNKKNNLTIVMVLHDINHAAQFADYVIVVRDGKVLHTGPPEKVIHTQMLEEVFGVRAEVFINRSGKPVFAPVQVLRKEK